MEWIIVRTIGGQHRKRKMIMNLRGEEEEGVAGLLTLASPSVMKKREEEKREAGSAEGSRYYGTEEGTGTDCFNRFL